MTIALTRKLKMLEIRLVDRRETSSGNNILILTQKRSG